MIVNIVDDTLALTFSDTSSEDTTRDERGGRRGGAEEERGPNDRDHTPRVRVVAEAGEKRKVLGFMAQRVTNVRVAPMGLLQAHYIRLTQQPTQETPLASPKNGVMVEKGPRIPCGQKNGL